MASSCQQLHADPNNPGQFVAVEPNWLEAVTSSLRLRL